jgi:hypothetical protein
VPIEAMLYVSAVAFGIIVLADLHMELAPGFKTLVYTIAFAPIVFAAVVIFGSLIVSAWSRPLAWGIGIMSIINGLGYFGAWIQLIVAASRGQFTSAEALAEYQPAWLLQWGSAVAAILIALGLAGMISLILNRQATDPQTA